ncbi:MAG: hypothetical protein AAF648_01410 [Pseudomonadota bacterium]
MTDVQQALPQALSNNLRLLEQLNDFLNVLPRELYQVADLRLPGSTLGRQIRHCLDHYEQLVAGLETGTVDYDARARSVAVECDPACALLRIEALRVELVRAAAARRGRPLEVCCCDGELSCTSLTRELDFVAAHTTHHLALMGLIARDHGVRLEDDFGVARATLRHRASESKILA